VHTPIRRFTALTSLLVAALAGSACAPSGAETGGANAADGEVFQYRVATIEGVGTPMNDAFETFIDEVETCSDGRLVGENFPAGQLGGFVDLIDGNRQGTYEITSGGFDVEGATAPVVSALSLGYVFEDEEHVERVIAEMQDEMSAKLDEATGASIIGMGEDGWRWVFSDRPVESIDDLAGLKIRVPEAEIPLGLWGKLGASATPVPFTEMYSALETGVIEAGESSLAQIEANAFWEPAPHLTNTQHWYNIKPVRANTEWLESLPQELQDCLHDVGDRVFADAREQNRAQAEETLAELEAQGATVHESPADLDVWRERSAEYDAEYFEKYPEAEAFIETVKSLADQ
jgi:TRAP-type C4-dicarboxylate transport system substrate-binding protein